LLVVCVVMNLLYVLLSCWMFSGTCIFSVHVDPGVMG
jgi:hypothetical protein